LINRTEKIGLVYASVYRSTEKPGVWINLLHRPAFCQLHDEKQG
jgi:hypothetical protein